MGLPDIKNRVTALLFEQYTSKVPIGQPAFLKSTLKGVCDQYINLAISDYIEDVKDTATYGSDGASHGLCNEPYKSKNRQYINDACGNKADTMDLVIVKLTQKYEAL
jgi:hypothetical protein